MFGYLALFTARGQLDVLHCTDRQDMFHILTFGSLRSINIHHKADSSTAATPVQHPIALSPYICTRNKLKDDQRYDGLHWLCILQVPYVPFPWPVAVHRPVLLFLQPSPLCNTFRFHLAHPQSSEPFIKTQAKQPTSLPQTCTLSLLFSLLVLSTTLHDSSRPSLRSQPCLLLHY